MTSDILTTMERMNRDIGIRADGTPMLTERAAFTKVPAPAPVPDSAPALVPDRASLPGLSPGICTLF